MSTGRCRVHVSLTDGSVLGSNVDRSLNFIVAGHGHIRESFYEHSSFGVLTDFEAFLGALVIFGKKISDFLVVDFDHGESDLVLDVHGGVSVTFGDTLEDLFGGTGNDTLVVSVTNDGVRFT